MENEGMLNGVRSEIDELDSQILPLLIKRMECSERVAQIKKREGLPIYNAVREAEIIEKLCEKAIGQEEAISSIYSAIFSASKMRQHGLLKSGGNILELIHNAKRSIPAGGVKLICQGVAGAYSHIAARKFFKNAEIEFHDSWDDVFSNINGNNFGVLPIENSAAGSVTDVYDLLLKYRYFIVGELDVKVKHCLASFDKNENISTAISHPQGIAQCSDYIKRKKLKTEVYSNTAAAALYVATQRPEGAGAICSLEAAQEYGLEIVEEEIQNNGNNTTRFILVSSHPIFLNEADKISLCFSVSHRTGSLYKVLERFAVAGLNLTKIESRPIEKKLFEYDFFLDFEGSVSDEKTVQVIAALSAELKRFSFLGNYFEEASYERFAESNEQ